MKEPKRRGQIRQASVPRLPNNLPVVRQLLLVSRNI